MDDKLKKDLARLEESMDSEEPFACADTAELAILVVPGLKGCIYSLETENEKLKAELEVANQRWDANEERCWYRRDKSCLGMEDKCPEDCKYNEPAKLKAENAQLQTKKQNILSAYSNLEARHDRYRETVSAINEMPDGHYWAWQADGDDHLESLTIPILIPAEWLRNMLDDARAESKSQITQLHAEAGVLQEALLAVEWGVPISYSDKNACPYCGRIGEGEGGHADSCLIAKALQVEAGRKLLARVKKLEAVAEAGELHVIAGIRGTWDDRKVLFAEFKQALAALEEK